MKGLIDVWKATAFGAACILTFPSFAMAQAAKAGVVTTLQGTATVVPPNRQAHQFSRHGIL